MKYPFAFSYAGIGLHMLNQLAREWELDFIQLRPGNLSVSLSQFITSNFQLGQTSFNYAVKQEGRSPEGVWTFAFPNDVSIY